MIAFENVTVAAGDFRLERISFEVEAGEYAVLQGRTGSGKTTLLEALCGLLRPVAGRVRIDGVDCTRRPPRERGIGYVPQDGALFPALTVREHLAFALKLRRWSRAQQSNRVSELAELLRLKPLLDRRPHGLSGGERQRVALGRALAFRPRVLCLDEPLSALDEASSKELRALLKQVKAQAGVTFLHVTHSCEEAERLGDRRLLLADGQVLSTVGGAAP